MSANMAQRENDLIVAAVEWLRERIPTWEIVPSPRQTDGAGATLEVRAHSAYATIAVEAKSSLTPRDVERLFGSVGRKLFALSPYVSILVVAPWLSPRTRELLRSEGLNYIDLTGNARVQLETPALFIESQGADRDPAPAPRPKARIRGPKAGRLLRTLVDVRPPYGVRELAEATALAPGYVSRLLDALDDEALVERSKRGRVESTDPRGLLRRWAESYEVFTSNAAVSFLAPPGAAQTLPRLSELTSGERAAVTGSFAAARIAAVAAPALLSVYTRDASAVSRRLGLIPADVGANVVLLTPPDDIVWWRTQAQGGVSYVAPSQAAVDCLTGNGRMPSEGEALLDWLTANEHEWRLDSLAKVA